LKVLKKDITTDLDHIYIVPLSDFHLGDPLFDREKLQGYVDWILNTPNAYTIINGDVFDCAIMGSKGNPYDAVMTVQAAKKVAKEILYPIRDRILGVTTGNHERRIYKATGNDVSEDLAMMLDVEDLYDAFGLIIHIVINEQTSYVIYVKHGAGGGKTQAYRLKKLKELADIVKDADIYLIGHVHDVLTFSLNPYFIDTETGAKKQMKQTYVSSGSYLNYGGYAEDLNFEPGKMGSPRLRLNTEHKDCHVSI
jgi:hypothetical protein